MLDDFGYLFPPRGIGNRSLGPESQDEYFEFVKA